MMIAKKKKKECYPNTHTRKSFGDFPGGPVTKTLCSQCRGPGFDPWSMNQIPHTAIRKKKDPE